MNQTPAVPPWRRRSHELATYPFRLGPPGPKATATPFGGLAIVNNLAGAGDALVTVALAGSVFVSVSLSAARFRTALGLLITVLPFAVVGPFVGPVIDRVRGGRKFIVFLAAIGRMAACLMMSAWIHSLLLFPAAFLSLVCSKTHAVAKASLVPGVVESDQDLVRANSKLAIGSAIFTSVGAAIGGLVYKVLGSHVVLDLDVLVFAAVAALSLYLLSGVKETAVAPGAVQATEPVAVPASTRRVAHLPRALRPGRFGSLPASGRRSQRPPVPHDVALAQVAMSGMRAVAGFMTALVVFGFRRNDAPVIWYGLVAVASVGGNFSGALLAPILRDRVSEKRLVAAAAALIALTALVTTQLPALHRRPAALVLAAVIGLGASVAKTAFDAIVQREIPDTDRSRLFARFESIFQLVWVVGALVPTLISVSLLPGFVLVALTVIATSTVFITGMARDRHHPAAADADVGGSAPTGPVGPPAAAPSAPPPPRWPAPAPAPDS